jgi:hypothetical protein
MEYRLKQNSIREWLTASVVWLSRIGHCRGFGIQSPGDYWFVRYVINEHWPYYQYNTLGKGDDWLTQKVGRLLFRIANWRQPSVIDSSAYQEYLQAGCRNALLVGGENEGRKEEEMESDDMVVMSLEGDYYRRLTHIYNKVNSDTVLIVADIRRAKDLWREIVADERSIITFDLYYCGIVMFDKKRHKQNYIINF